VQTYLRDDSKQGGSSNVPKDGLKVPVVQMNLRDDSEHGGS
jgi:hypothetical protein